MTCRAKECQISPEAREVCRRVHTTALQWYERPVNSIAAEAKAEQAKSGRAWWPKVGTKFSGSGIGGHVRPDPRDIIPIHTMTPAQRAAELKRLSARLA